jgi:hypothetical protein
MATRVLHRIKFFEKCLTTKGTFLWSLDEIGLAVYEMLFKVKVYGRMNKKRSQKNHESI